MWGLRDVAIAMCRACGVWGLRCVGLAVNGACSEWGLPCVGLQYVRLAVRGAFCVCEACSLRGLK